MATLTGLHHLKFPVTNLELSIDWYTRVFDATHIKRFDHYDRTGHCYAVVILIPGIAELIELRLDPAAAQGIAGFDPVTFGVVDNAALQQWIEHLDRLGVPHSPPITGYIGQVVRLSAPDGMTIQIYTDPADGFESATFDRSIIVEPAGHRITDSPA